MQSPDILFEDNDILVIDKPPGYIVNRADTTVNQPTIQEWVGLRPGSGPLRRSFSEASEDRRNGLSESEGVRLLDRRGCTPSGSETAVDVSDPGSEFEKRGGVVHRLDKETSGILIIAKNEESFINLQTQFREGRVKKTYIGLCHGEIKPLEGEINIPIGRLPWNRMRFGVLPQGREARSKYKVLSIKYLELNGVREPLSLVEVYPETGRTHQIRVHMQYIGHPIFSDELYAGRKISKRDRKLLPRHFLHASKIRFEHPKTSENLEFESPLPSDLQDFVNTLL